MEPYRPRAADKRVCPITFPLPLWMKIQRAALRRHVSAAEWIRQACREKLEGS